MMNGNDYEDKELDRLLKELPAPEAPAWFKQKTLNRLKAEQSKKFRFSSWWTGISTPRLAFVGTAAAALVLAAILFTGQGSDPSVPRADVSLDNALDAFVSFTDENSDWGGDPFL